MQENRVQTWSTIVYKPGQFLSATNRFSVFSGIVSEVGADQEFLFEDLVVIGRCWADHEHLVLRVRTRSPGRASDVSDYQQYYDSPSRKHLPHLFKQDADATPVPSYEPAELRVFDAVLQALKTGTDTLDGAQAREFLDRYGGVHTSGAEKNGDGGGGVLVIDVRPRDQFAEKLQGKHAVNVPLAELLADGPHHQDGQGLINQFISSNKDINKEQFPMLLV